MASKVNVLLIGAAAPAAPGIIKCLLQDDWINLTIADSSSDAVGRHLHSNFVQLQGSNEEHFVQQVLSYCLENGVQVVFPLASKNWLPLANHKEIFAHNDIKILVSPPQALELAANRTTCYAFLKSKNIPVPEFHKAQTAEDFMHAAFELGHPKRDFCFMPSEVHGNRGYRVVADSIDESDQLFNQHPYSIQIAYPLALSILSAKPFPELLVTEHLPGEEYEIACLAEHGKAVLAVPFLLKGNRNGMSTAGECVREEQLIEYAARIIEAIGLHGNIVLQAQRSASGVPLLTKIYPGAGEVMAVALGTGVNLPLLAIRQDLGLPLEQHELNVVWGTQFSRYWTELFY